MLEYKTLYADDQSIEQQINEAAKDRWEVAFVNIANLGEIGRGTVMVHVVLKPAVKGELTFSRHEGSPRSETAGGCGA